MKVKEMSTNELKSEMSKIQNKCVTDCKWVHENKRWKGLLNEYERRVMGRSAI